ncbi:hypothetical protein ACEV99_19750 [Vibrio parahaemolyticus]|nr:hypothetical protein [Vibrio parahaemolyticus]
MKQKDEVISNLQKSVVMTEYLKKAQQVYLEPLQLNLHLPTDLGMSHVFLFFYERYPEHRRPETKRAEKVWHELELSDGEARGVLEWLIDRQAIDPSWHPLAKGIYVPKLENFLKNFWWLTPKADRRS